MQNFAFYAGALLGALILSVIVEWVIELTARLRKRDVRSRPQHVFNRERLIRMLFVAALFFILSVFGKNN